MPYKKECLICKKEFISKRKKKFLCANKKCIYKHHANRMIGHKSFNNLSGSKNPNWRGGVRIDKDGYKLIYSPKHPNSSLGYVREHRLVMEEHLKRFLFTNEIVHHKNGNKQDNAISNLVLMGKIEHDKEHFKTRKKNVLGQLL